MLRGGLWRCGWRRGRGDFDGDSSCLVEVRLGGAFHFVYGVDGLHLYDIRLDALHDTTPSRLPRSSSNWQILLLV
jgi:hypothetical protein